MQQPFGVQGCAGHWGRYAKQAQPLPQRACRLFDNKEARNTSRRTDSCVVWGFISVVGEADGTRGGSVTGSDVDPNFYASPGLGPTGAHAGR